MPNRPSLSLAACFLLALLSACGSDAPGSDEGNGRAVSGEVLEGTISDAMLPLDHVRSQAPRAEADAVSGQAQGTAGAQVEEAAAPDEEVPAENTPETSEEAAEAR